MVTLKDLARTLHISEEELKIFIDKKFLPHLQDSFAAEKIPKKLTHAWVRELFSLLGLGFNRKNITVAALKGGIGKTFLTTNLAIRISSFGARVLIIDLDPEACATNSLLCEEEVLNKDKITILEIFKNSMPLKKGICRTKYSGLDIVPASLRITKTDKVIGGKNPKWLLKKLVDEVHDYDFIFFELPPSFSSLSSSAYLASDLVLIPCTPNIFSLESVDLTIEAVTEVAKEFECPHIEFKVLMNMYNPNRNASQDTLNLLKDDHATHLLPFKIKESADIQNAINAGLSIYESKCGKSIRDEMDLLLETICPLGEELNQMIANPLDLSPELHQGALL